MRWLRILSTDDFDIQHRAGTKHGNADSLSRASHAPFLSKWEAQEVLADDQILLIGEALEDDGQESEEDDSLSESDETDPRIPAKTEFLILKDLMSQQLLNSKVPIRPWQRSSHGSINNINPRRKSTNYSLPMKIFMLIALNISN